jgi:hypothetical protein
MRANSHKPVPFFRVLRANLVCAPLWPGGATEADGLIGSRPGQARLSTAPQPGLGQQRHNLPRRHGMGTFGQSGAVAFGNDVVVITLEPASRETDPGCEVMQLLVRPVTDHVRPELTVAGPYWRVDVDRQR